MFVALFVAGFCAAIAWVASFSITQVPKDSQQQDQAMYQPTGGYGEEYQEQGYQPMGEYVDNEMQVMNEEAGVPESQEGALGDETVSFDIEFGGAEAALPKPDLAIENFSVNGPFVSKSYEVYADVFNKSTVKVYSGSRVNFQVDKGVTGTYTTFGWGLIGPLGADASQRAGMGLLGLTSGMKFRVRVCADALNQVSESNENNNCTTPISRVVP